MSKQIKDRFYKSKDLLKDFYGYFDCTQAGISKYLSKENFSKFWKSKIISIDILFDFFDSIGIRVGVTPSKFGNYWTIKVQRENKILIINDYCIRKDAVEAAVIKAIDIYEE